MADATPGTRPGHALRPARLEIDLDAIARNWKAFARHVAPGVCAGVVKADAYGMGMDRVAHALRAAGCGVFVTATAGEALALRGGLGDTAPDIWCLGGAHGAGLRALAEARIGIVLNSFEDIAAWRALPDPPRAALHVDTGMNRLGLAFHHVSRALDALGGVRVDYLFTHLVSGAEPEKCWNTRQTARLEGWRTAFPGTPLSVANSGGALSLPQRPGDMVRVGIALYGSHPAPGVLPSVQAVASMLAPVLQVREIPAGDTVGYDATWTAARPSRLATIAAGYADGLPRSLSNRGVVLVGGHLCPIVGRVSMDTIVVDITDAGPVTPGEEATIFGADLPVEGLADAAGTIAYEVLCSTGRACRRVWKGC